MQKPALDLSEVFKGQAEIGIQTSGCFGGHGEAIKYPTPDKELNETLKTLVSAFANRTLSGEYTGMRISNAYTVVVNNQAIHTTYQFSDIPVEMRQLQDAIMKAGQLAAPAASRK